MGISKMKRIWLFASAATAALSASSMSFAADLANRSVYAQPAPVPPLPVYNWTGFYIGGNIGGAWANGTVTDNVTGASLSGSNAGVIGGGTIGYNWQFAPNWVVGVEATFDGTSIKNNNTVNGTYLDPSGNAWPVSIQGSANTNWVATIAGRLGFAANNWLFYAKGGGGWANDSVTITGVSQTGPAPGVLPTGWTGGTVSASNTAAGWLAGAGIEYGLTQNWTVKAEYDYLGLAGMTVNSPFVVGDTVNVSRNINMFTVSVNYKF